MSEHTDHKIAIGTAVNATATLARGYEDPVDAFCVLLPKVAEAVLLVHQTYPAPAEVNTPALAPQTAVSLPQAAPVPDPVAQAVQAVTAAFPGTVQVPQAQQPVVPVVPTAVVQPAAIPGATDGDAETNSWWQSFFQALNAGQVAGDFKTAREGQWMDNRFGKSNPKQPDFKVKQAQGVQGGPALWKSDKKNPAWVGQALTQAGL